MKNLYILAERRGAMLSPGSAGQMPLFEYPFIGFQERRCIPMFLSVVQALMYQRWLLDQRNDRNDVVDLGDEATRSTLSWAMQRLNLNAVVILGFCATPGGQLIARANVPEPASIMCTTADITWLVHGGAQPSRNALTFARSTLPTINVAPAYWERLDRINGLPRSVAERCAQQYVREVTRNGLIDIEGWGSQVRRFEVFDPIADGTLATATDNERSVPVEDSPSIERFGR